MSLLYRANVLSTLYATTFTCLSNWWWLLCAFHVWRNHFHSLYLVLILWCSCSCLSSWCAFHVIQLLVDHLHLFRFTFQKSFCLRFLISQYCYAALYISHIHLSSSCTELYCSFFDLYWTKLFSISVLLFCVYWTVQFSLRVLS